MAAKREVPIDESNTLIISDKRDGELPGLVMDLVRMQLKAGLQEGRLLLTGLHGPVIWAPKEDRPT